MDKIIEETKAIHRKHHFLKTNKEWNYPIFPMQNWNDMTIPLIVAQEGYKEYAAQQGTDQSLERLGERGGFAGSELCILLFERIKRLEMRTVKTEVHTKALATAIENRLKSNEMGETCFECAKRGEKEGKTMLCRACPSGEMKKAFEEYQGK